jgi:RNA polymerase sigma-70 factor (ECF subfamily)
MPDDTAAEADEQLWRVQQGDPQAIEGLLQFYRAGLRRYAAGILGPKMARRLDTSDLVQESLTRAFNRVQQFRGSNRAEFFGWLKAIVRNEAVRLQRYHLTEKRNVNLDLSSKYADPDDGLSDPGCEVAEQENMVCIAVALESLPDNEREVVHRRSLECQSFEEIARDMNRTAASVKALWTRGIRRLRRILDVSSASSSN